MLRRTNEARQWKLHELTGGLGPYRLRGRLQHPGDARDADDIERERALTDRLDAAVAVLVTERDERVRLPHLVPWQWAAEEPLRVDADVFAAILCFRAQRVDVARCVDALSRRVIRWIGRSSSRRLALVHLDELGTEVDLHELTIGTHANVL